MKKLVRNCIIILMIVIWLFPVSNEMNRLNENMSRNCYILNLLLLLLCFIHEKTIINKQLLISGGIIALLFIFTMLFHYLNPENTIISYGYLLNYIPFCILINVFPKDLSKSNILDKTLIFICVLLIVVGLLTVFNNSFVEQLLKTYYINHYPHVYTVMWMNLKTVTFFATHSISCYIYFIIWWMLEKRRQVIKGRLNYYLIAGILFDIIMCLSVSAVLCTGIIGLYYYISWTKKATKKSIIYSLLLLIILAAFVIINLERIITILTSGTNGILGRYGSTGNLNDTLKWALTNVLPIGINDVDGLWLTDGGYYINYIRGGLLFVILLYVGLYNYIKQNVSNRRDRFVLFISLMLFEVGYQFTTCMRFFMIMIFAMTYYRYLETRIKVFSGELEKKRWIVSI